jgi:hypothetical protein
MDSTRFLRFAERSGFTVDVDAIFQGKIEGLLTTNPKVEKGVGSGYATAILHLSPSTRSGFQTCSNATAGCAAACLNTAGRGGIFANGEDDNAIQKARRRRTHWFFARRLEFLEALDREVTAHVRRAARKGLRPAVRLNGTSDIRWEDQRFPDGSTIFDRHPNVVFYDYTKHADRDVSDIPNYSLTFSLAESNMDKALRAMSNGLNVAAVFKQVPTEFLGRPVVDGDETDLRFLDPSGVIVGLKAKGAAKTDKSGFVR